MKLETKVFGTIEYQQGDVIVFDAGLYGFEKEKEFLYVQSEDNQFQFNWLQSIATPELTFIVTTPFLFVEDYKFDIEDQLIEQLEINETDDMTIMSVVNISDDVEQTTINIKAPLILNIKTKIGKQIILSEDYPYKYYIFKNELNNKE